MFLSIIIAAKNWDSALNKTIFSVLRQTSNDFEVIVQVRYNVGNVNFRELYPESVNFYEEDDAGIYDALNRGIEKAKGDFILFLGQGDYLTNDFVIENFIELSKQGNAAFWGEVFYYKNENEIIKRFKIKNKEISRRSFKGGNPLHTQGLIIKREIYQEFKYDTQYKILADFEFLLRSDIWKNLRITTQPAVMFELGGASTNITTAANSRKEAIVILLKYNILPSFRLLCSFIYYRVLNILKFFNR
ncbi:glycosyltransferase [Mucilaginibacter sp. UYCu711]|uniref:glycosyltransferase n=1 Tax=Mucilaginibacter sp. UYCu711 TaxID=3156339 RepID=UPI003D230812